MDAFADIPVSCATVSIGTLFVEGGYIPLADKIAAIADAGFHGIEIALWDLQPFASILLQKDVGINDFDDLAIAAQEVRDLCDARDLKVVVLVACFQIEGWPEKSEQRQHAFSTIKDIKQVMRAVGTDLLLVAASDADGITDSIDSLAADLVFASDILAKDGYRMAYENLCWATAAPTWKSGWELIQKVNRDNVGLCLDTFHIAGYEWADPSTASAVREEAGINEIFATSLQELATTIAPEKIFLFQIGDAYRFPHPILPTKQVKPREIWAKNSRPLPCDDNGYLPVVEVIQAVWKTGYRGWYSMEIFDGGPGGNQPRPNDPKRHALDAMLAYVKSMEHCTQLSDTSKIAGIGRS